MSDLKSVVNEIIKSFENGMCGVDTSDEAEERDEDDDCDGEDGSEDIITSLFYTDGYEFATNYFAERGLTLKNEASFGGEGQGEAYWSVYSITNGTDTVYVKFDGYYMSYDGSTYERWFFVEPKQVMVTEYDEVTAE